MSKAIRLGDDLCREASAKAKLMHRSIPLQIEYWAKLGKSVESFVNPEVLISLLQGSVQLEVKPVYTPTIDTDNLFGEVESKKANLERHVSVVGYHYESSLSSPGFLDKVFTDGERITGRFENGEFISP
jgi:hypothetical protein